MCLVLLQLDMPRRVAIHGRPPFSGEKVGEEWMGNRMGAGSTAAGGEVGREAATLWM